MIQPNSIFLKQIIFCFSVVIISTILLISNNTKENSLIYYIVMMLCYMPCPLYSVILFDKQYFKTCINSIKSTNYKKLFKHTLISIAVFWTLISFNYLFFYLGSSFFPKSIIGVVSFNNKDILENLINLLPKTVNLPLANFSNKNGFPLFFSIVIFSTIIGIIFNSLFTFTEEVGWRGSITNNLFINNKFLKNIVIGSIWGLWHAPLIIAFGYNYPNLTPVSGIVMMICFCILLHTLFIEINCSSILPSTFLHGCINASPAIYLLFHSNNSDFFSLICGLIPFFSIITIILIIKAIKCVIKLQ